MSDWIIRPANKGDIPAIVRFNSAMALETEDKQIDQIVLTQGITALLNNPERGFYTMAESAGQCVGQVMVTYEWSDWRNGTFWWIQSVYIDPAWRRRGVYTSLYRHILKQAQAQPGICGLRLYVDHHNRTAQNTYTTLGMAAAHYDLFEVDFVYKNKDR